MTVEVRRKRTYVKQGSLQTDSEEISITKKTPAVSQSELEAQRIRDLEETRAKAEEQTRIELEKKKDISKRESREGRESRARRRKIGFQ